MDARYSRRRRIRSAKMKSCNPRFAGARGERRQRTDASRPVQRLRSEIENAMSSRPTPRANRARWSRGSRVRGLRRCHAIRRADRADAVAGGWESVRICGNFGGPVRDRAARRQRDSASISRARAGRGRCARFKARWSGASRRARSELARANAGLEAEIAERRLADQRVVHMAHHDALTGLPNRTLLADRVGQAIARAASQRRQARRAVPRPRSLQEHQRLARPRDRRSAAARRSPRGSRAACATRTPWRAWAATSSSSACPTSPTTARSRHAWPDAS